MDDKDLNKNSTAPEEESMSEKVVSQEEFDQVKDQYLRTLAELVNTQKNAQLDKQKAKQSILLKIIDIIETYQIILQNEDKEAKNETYNHMRNLLQQLEIMLITEGVKKAEINIGDQYDPKYAEVITTVQGDEDGKIVEVIMPAYEMYDQIIKTGKVIVSKKS